MTTRTSKQQTDNNLPISFADRQKMAIQTLHALCIRPELSIKDYKNAYQNIDLAPAEEKEEHLYGVVLEWEVEDERHLLAAYTNCYASYISDNGKATVWSNPEYDHSFDALIEDVLDSGRDMLAGNMPTLEDSFFQPIEAEQIRVLILSSHGILAAEAAYEELSKAPMGEEMVKAARQLSRWLLKD